MSADYSITQGAERPTLQRTWLDSAGDPVDLSTDTLSLRIGTSPPIEKTNGVTGDANGIVTITWAADELDNIAPGVYRAQVWSRDGANLDRVMPLTIAVTSAVPTP